MVRNARCLLMFIGLVLPAAASAQVPAVPAAPAVPAGPAQAAGAAQAAAGPLARFCAMLEDCKRKTCATPAGQLINGITKPLTALTGGVIPPFCPVMPTEADLKKPGVAGAADVAKKDALEAKARQGAVRYLGTLDCRYYPDAALALVAALRTDGNECVRYEAAVVLGRGCCCTQKTLEALIASVSGTEADGNPAERSVRVRCAAAAAMDRCLACGTSLPPPEVEVEEKKPTTGDVVIPKSADVAVPNGDTKPTDKKDEVKPSDKDKKDKEKDGIKPILPTVSRLPNRATLETARRTLTAFQNQVLATNRTPVTTGETSVYQILKTAVGEVGGNPNATFASIVETPRPAPAVLPMTLPAPAVVREATVLPAPAPTAIPTPKFLPTPMVKPAAVEAALPTIPVIPAAAIVVPAAPKPDAGYPAEDLTKWIVLALNAKDAKDRHAAIRELVKSDWTKHPAIPQTLLNVAKSDLIPAVRVDALRHLTAYKMTHPTMNATLETLSRDSDTWVAEEAGKLAGK